jgi:hypothetical protein
MIHSEDVTLIVVDNQKLKHNRYAYEMSVNYIDHMMHKHIMNGGQVQYTKHYDDVVSNITTPFSKTVEIGQYFNVDVLLKNSHIKNGVLAKNTTAIKDMKNIKFSRVWQDVYDFKKASIDDGGSSPHQVFSTSTEMLIKTERSFDHVVGCANGLQVLSYIKPSTETVTIIDLNQDAINFTKQLLYDWNTDSPYSGFIKSLPYKYNQPTIDAHKYLKVVEHMNPLMYDTLDYIRSNKIHVQFVQSNMLNLKQNRQATMLPNTLLYFSSILSYSRTCWDLPLINADLIFNDYMSTLDETSTWIGEVPYNKDVVFNKKDFEVSSNPRLRTAWRHSMYDKYYIKAINEINEASNI